MKTTGTFGDRIARLRRQANLTQADLAQKLGISAQAVSQWERGETMPDIMTLPHLADILGCTVDVLLRQNEEEENTETEAADGSAWYAVLMHGDRVVQTEELTEELLASVQKVQLLIEGDAASVTSTFSVEVNGSVQGDVLSPQGNITVEGDVGGDAVAQGNIAAGGSIGGEVTAGGNLAIGKNAQGDATAGGNVAIGGDSAGEISAGGYVTVQGDAAGDLSAGSEIRVFGDANGDISAGGGVNVEGDANGDISAGGGVNVGGDVTGDIESEGAVSVSGSVTGDIETEATAAVTGDVTGNIRAGGEVTVQGNYLEM